MINGIEAPDFSIEEDQRTQQESRAEHLLLTVAKPVLFMRKVILTAAEELGELNGGVEREFDEYHRVIKQQL